MVQELKLFIYPAKWISSGSGFPSFWLPSHNHFSRFFLCTARISLHYSAGRSWKRWGWVGIFATCSTTFHLNHFIIRRWKTLKMLLHSNHFALGSPTLVYFQCWNLLLLKFSTNRLSIMSLSIARRYSIAVSWQSAKLGCKTVSWNGWILCLQTVSFFFWGGGGAETFIYLSTLQNRCSEVQS